VWWNFLYPFNCKFTQESSSEKFLKSVKSWQNYGHGGVVAQRWGTDLRSRGREFDSQPGRGCVVRNDSGQVVHTQLPRRWHFSLVYRVCGPVVWPSRPACILLYQQIRKYVQIITWWQLNQNSLLIRCLCNSVKCYLLSTTPRIMFFFHLATAHAAYICMCNAVSCCSSKLFFRRLWSKQPRDKVKWSH